ncbi:MAG: hypothetical protein ACTSUE_24595 [Promethearchaeota archaeon]
MLRSELQPDAVNNNLYRPIHPGDPVAINYAWRNETSGKNQENKCPKNSPFIQNLKSSLYLTSNKFLPVV